MKKNELDIDTLAGPNLSERLVKRLARVLLPVISAIITIQPAAYAAPNPSLLLQEPRFLDVTVESNVMFIMDDSLSMDDIQLPVPAGLSPTAASTGAAVGCAAGEVRISGGLCVPRDAWIHRASTLNPLYYNPALTYRPWNDNGRSGAASNFPAATVGSGSIDNNWFRPGETEQDRRYVGPNYTASRSSSAQQQRRSTVTGANPPGVPDYLKTSRLPSGGFAGATASGRNQDLFTSPMVFVQSTTPICSVPVGINSAPQPTVVRTPSPLGFTPRTITDLTPSQRNSFPRLDSPIPWTQPDRTLPTNVTPRSLTTRTLTNRTITDRTLANRTITNRAVSSRTITDRTISNRTITNRVSTPQVVTARPVQYRLETGTCNVFEPWVVVASAAQVPAASGLCSDPTAEGGVRARTVETMPADCPSGSNLQGGSCVTPCGSGTSLINGNCVANCPSGSSAISDAQCRTDCPSGSTAVSGTDQCISSCPGGSSVYSFNNNQCISNCSGTVTGPNDTQCMAACGVGTSVYSFNNAQCISNCNGTVTGQNDTQCLLACPGGTSNLNATQCISNCPGGTDIFAGNSNQCIANCDGDIQGPNGTQCLAACAAGSVQDPNNANQCLTCGAGSVFNAATNRCERCLTGTYAQNPNQSNAWQCRQTCAGVTDANGRATVAALNNTVCRTTCSGAGTNSVVFNGQLTCFLACPNNTSAGSGQNINQCYPSCPSGTSTFGTNQCITNCAGTTGQVNGQEVCYSTCPAGSELISGTCYANCAAGETAAVVNGQQICRQACPAGTTAGANNTCLSCPAGSSLFNGNSCCQNGAASLQGCPAQLPSASPWSSGTPAVCSTADRWYPDQTKAAPAHYYAFNPPDTTRAPTLAEQSDPSNYVLVQINRDAPMRQSSFTTPYVNNDPTRGRAVRLDCAARTSCTWDEEAANFANWFTYYRTRLFSAIAVTSESLSGLTAGRGLDSLRLGYGSINYFPSGGDPYSSGYCPNCSPPTPPSSRLPSSIDVDGVSSSFSGAIVRGVRPFTQNTAANPFGGDSRQEVFDWLFSLTAIGSTPNREALDSVGRYFARTDNQGPWIQPGSGNDWRSNEDALDHISCRRNYVMLLTDGEWTRSPWVAGAPQQPLVDGPAGSRDAFPTALTNQGGTPVNALTTAMTTAHENSAGLAPAQYSYVPANEPQFSNNAGSTVGTLTDVALFYWSRDLRPDLQNNVKPQSGNSAYWQHMTPFIVGYGISASMDTPATRSAVAGGLTVSWPTVQIEPRGANQFATITTDRDTIPPNSFNCSYDAGTNPSGCGRVDDTLRAALAARGDFLAAADASRLADGIRDAFARISEIEGSATSVGGRSATFSAGDRVFLASFKTNRWTGRVDSFDAQAWLNAAVAGSAEPTTAPDRVSSSLPAAASRSIFTATALTTGAALPTGQVVGSTNDFDTLPAAYRTALNNDPALLRWLRGDQTTETRNGGLYRNRADGEILGDIINSSPLYSKATDFGYGPARRPAGDTAADAMEYRNFVQANNARRPATLFVGANDGMLHAFDVSGSPVTSASNYNANYMRERFAYIPRAMYPQLARLASPAYVHRYYVDGQVVEGDAYLNGAWRKVVVGTSGAGPKSVFALDVTLHNGSTTREFSAADVLFDIAGTDTATNIEHLGHIMGPGVIGSGKDGRWYYFVGNGYESTNDKAKLLAIDLSNGSIFVVDTDNAGGSDPAASARADRPNGLGAITPIYDSNRNVIGAYAGDRLGRLWKFDLSSTSRSSWSSTLLFDTVGTSGNGNPQASLDSQPITAAPRIAPFPLGGRIIVFGTGRLTERGDPASTAVQSVYAIREDPSSVSRVQWSQMYTGLSLREEEASGRRFRILDGTAGLDWTTHRGWYFDLRVRASGNGPFQNTGERVVVTPIEQFGFMNIMSFEPTGSRDRCSGGGRSFFYRLDVTGSFTRQPFVNEGPLTNLNTSIPRTQVVGADMPAMLGLPAIAGAAAPSTASAGGSLSSTGLSNILGGTASPVTNPCGSPAVGRTILAQASGTLRGACAIPSLRVWRELPRGPRN